jgi:hypothetical protein
MLLAFRAHGTSNSSLQTKMVDDTERLWREMHEAQLLERPRRTLKGQEPRENGPLASWREPASGLVWRSPRKFLSDVLAQLDVSPSKASRHFADQCRAHLEEPAPADPLEAHHFARRAAFCQELLLREYWEGETPVSLKTVLREIAGDDEKTRRQATRRLERLCAGQLSRAQRKLCSELEGEVNARRHAATEAEIDEDALHEEAEGEERAERDAQAQGAGSFRGQPVARKSKARGIRRGPKWAP